jgi:hypothetical protein
VNVIESEITHCDWAAGTETASLIKAALILQNLKKATILTKA